ncbi:MAG: 23S rRNA pseudouridine(2604) synthase RluF [bacterium]|nr:23S rRNA pseudouridine(2604) synthase RluF [bacterium]
MKQQAVRINKFLSQAGICSRREADRALEAGQIQINGHVAVLGDKVYPGDTVRYRGNTVTREQERILIAFHKPRGVICSTSSKQGIGIVDYINYPKRIYPVGRLDKDSTGLIFLTNDGELVNKIMRAGNYHEKEYVVTVDKEVTDSFVKKMSSGVPILDTVTRPCKVVRIEKKKFRIVLTQGLNRQIRRMCEYLGYRVTGLHRVRIMNVELGSLPEGKYRDLTRKEWHDLEKMLISSSSETVIDSERGKHGKQ